MKSICSLLVALGGSLHFSYAGTSVGANHLQEVIDRSPVKTYAVITKGLKFNESGEALRLGRHFGSLVGTPVGPYTFKAHHFSGKVVRHHMVKVTTSWSIKDAKNVDYGMTLPENFAEPLRVSEVVTGIEVSDFISSQKLELTPENKNTEPVDNQAEAQPNTIAPQPDAQQGQGYSGTLSEGDRLYAGEYFSDTYAVALAAGEKIKVVVHANGFTPVILTKKNGRYSNSAGSTHGNEVNGKIELEYTAASDSAFQATVTCKNKTGSGIYVVSFYIDGKLLPSPKVGSDQGEGNILIK